ncbi:MAG: hypothetical protein NTX49_00470, partial [Chlamydiae bacterium]|nr:hypothetical protein [Chlamydiota bacterium]
MLKGFKKSNIQAFLLASCLITLDGYADTWNPDPALTINASFGSNSPSVFSSCNSLTGNFLATWLHTGDFFPYYSIYNHTTSLWGPPLPIISASAGATGTMAFSAFDSSTGNFLVTWQNGTDISTNNAPFYSLYINGAWSGPAA